MEADHLIDASILRGARSRFATTSVKYKLPALILEDIEMSVDEIRCSDSMITVEFSHQQMLDDARETWDNLPELLIISSHPGCNENGERAPYL